MLKILIFCVLFTLPWFAPAYALSAVTLPQCIHIALEYNKDLQAAQVNVAIAKARLIQAKQWPNPSLNFSNNDDKLFKDQGEYTRSVGFSEKFPIAHRIARQKEVARVDVVLALTEIADAKRRLAGTVASLFYQLVVIDKRLHLLSQQLAVDRTLVQATQARFKVAEVSELDVNTAQLQYQNRLQQQRILTSQRVAQLAQFNALLGRPASMPLIIQDSVPSRQDLLNLRQEQRLALTLRPDLQATWLREHRAEADQALARAQRFEDWTIGIAVQQDRLAIDELPPQSSDRTLTVTLAIPLPIVNTYRGRIKEAQAAGIQANLTGQALQLRILNEVAGAYAQVLTLQNTLQHFNTSLLSLSRRNVQLAQYAYHQGQIALFEVVQAQRQQSDLQASYIDALNQYLQASVRLKTVVGNILPIRSFDSSQPM